MRAFIIDDEKIVTQSIAKKLLEHSFESTIFKNIKDFQKFKGDKNADIYIVDIGLPDGDGLELIQDIRSKNIQSPVIILSGFRGPEIRIKGLEIGADDYIEKPFSIDEIIIRIKRLRNRFSPQIDTLLTYRDFNYNRQTKQLSRNSQNIYLTKIEKSLVSFFIENIGRAISKEELILSVWNKHTKSSVTENNINVHICKLRGKLGPSFGLKTLSGEGYILQNSENT